MESAAAPPQAAPRALRQEFTRLLLLAVILPVLLLGVLLSWKDAHDRRARVTERLQATVEATAEDIDEFVDTHLGVVEVVAARRTAEGTVDDDELWRADLARLQARYDGLLTMLVTDAEGRIRVSAPALAATATPRSVSDRAYFRVPRESRRAYVSGAFRGRTLGQDALVAVSAPMFGEDGAFAGVVEGSISVEAFVAPRGDWLRQRGYEAILLDGEGRVVDVTPGLPWSPLQRPAESAAGRALAALPAAGEGETMRLLPGVLRDGGDAYALAEPLRTGWRLALLVPKANLDAEARRNLLTLVLLLGLILFGVIAVAWLQMRRITASVRRLLDRLHQVAVDRVAPPIPPQTMPAELAPLAEALNQLSQRLDAADVEVQRSLEEQRRLRSSLQSALADREREVTQRTQELRRANAELDRISRTDALTGCLNYRGFLESCERLWREASASERPLSVLALDIDHFKAYNDRYGHQAGDNALQRFAGVLRSALYRSGDVATRPGGEEFIVLLPDTTLAQARQAAERICASLRRAEIAHGGAPGGIITVSIGVATRQHDDGEDPESMLRRADDALYRAKRDGRDRVSD